MTHSNGQRHPAGVVRAIAHRPVDGEPMQEARECHVVPRRGIVAENRKHGKREITLLSAQAWAEVCGELGVELPWSMRRANLLIEGVDLAQTIGRTITVGPVNIYVHGETKPCKIMDAQHPGLRAALAPACRGGVHGQVLTEGTIRVGDEVGMKNGE